MGLLKNQTDIRHLKEAGRLAADLCDDLIAHLRPGISTLGLEVQANKLLQQNRSTAPFKSFEGFGNATCISINDEIVNGPPSRERLIQEGDLVKIAIGTNIRGIHGKAARTAYVGDEIPRDVQRLMDGTAEILRLAPELCPPGTNLNQLLAHIPEIAKKNDLTVIHDSGGSGIGKHLHEAPNTPNNPGTVGQGTIIETGMAFTLMPMMTLGTSDAWERHADGWTQVTQEHTLAAHFADTFLMTPDGLVNLGTLS